MSNTSKENEGACENGFLTSGGHVSGKQVLPKRITAVVFPVCLPVQCIRKAGDKRVYHELEQNYIKKIHFRGPLFYDTSAPNVCA